MSEWLLYREEVGIVGPVDSGLLLQGIADGRVPADTKVRRIDETAWRALSLIPIFSLAVRMAPPAAATPTRPPLDGFAEAAAEAAAEVIASDSLRPQVREAPRPVRRRARRRPGYGGVVLGIAAGAALGLCAVLVVARSMPSLRAPAAALVARPSLMFTFQRVAALATSAQDAVEAPAAPAVVAEAEPPQRPSVPSRPRPVTKRNPAPRPAAPPVRFDEPGF